MSLILLLAGLLSTVVGGLWSATELHIRVSGRGAVATIIDITPGRGRTAINYAFSDEEGLDKTGSFSAEENWQPPEDMRVQVVYLPGRPETVRLASDKSYTGFIVLACGLAITALGFWLFKNERIAQQGDRLVKDETADEKSNPFGKLIVPQARGKKPK